MSNKLKRKAASVKSPIPYTNRQAQHFAAELHATYSQLKKMEEDIWREAWNEAEEWANIVNTVTTMMALHELYRWKGEIMLKVVKKANEYVAMANKGERTILSMMDELEEKYGFGFDKGHREMVKKYGL